MTRIVICGGPKTGKTTLAKAGAVPGFMLAPDEAQLVTIRHTDDVMALGWSEASAEVATWFDAPGPWIIEGVGAVRALRKWIAAHEGKPCDVVLWLEETHVERTPGQVSMANGCGTVWREIDGELRERGVRVCYGVDEMQEAA